MKTNTDNKKAANPRPAGAIAKKAAAKKSAIDVHELADGDMQEEGFDELEVQAAKPVAKKAVATKAEGGDDDDDDDDLPEEDDDAIGADIDDDAGDPDNDEEAYKLDKDFEEFDLPKSKTKSAGTAGTKRTGGDEIDDDFRDLGLDLGGGGGGRYADDDDDF